MYHTALKRENINVPYVELFEQDGDIAFKSDIVKNGLDMRYNTCDLLWAEIPWRAGHEKFNSRAGKTGEDYKEFMFALQQIVIENNKPMVIVCSKTEVKNLFAEKVVDITLNGYPAKAILYNGADLQIGLDYREAYEVMAKRYNRVGDFCCGYGNIGMVFKKHGKNFVMGDINGLCIGYIQENYKYWK